MKLVKWDKTVSTSLSFSLSQNRLISITVFNSRDSDKDRQTDRQTEWQYQQWPGNVETFAVHQCRLCHHVVWTPWYCLLAQCSDDSPSLTMTICQRQSHQTSVNIVIQAIQTSLSAFSPQWVHSTATNQSHIVWTGMITNQRPSPLLRMQPFTHQWSN